MFPRHLPIQFNAHTSEELLVLQPPQQNFLHCEKVKDLEKELGTISSQEFLFQRGLKHFFDSLAVEVFQIPVELRQLEDLGYDDPLLFSGSLILCADLQDTIFVDFKGDVNLGHTTGGRRNACQIELASKWLSFVRGLSPS